VAGKQDKIGM